MPFGENENGLNKQKHIFGQLGFVLFFVGVFVSWKIQSLGILPKFFDVGVILILSLMLIFFSYQRKIMMNIFKNPSLSVLGLSVIISYGLIASLYIGDSKNTIWCLFGLTTIFIYSSLDYKKIIFDQWSVLFCIIFCLLFLFEATGRGSFLLNALVRQSINENNHAYGLAAYTAIGALLFSISSINRKMTWFNLLVVSFLFLIAVLIVFISAVRSPLFGVGVALLIFIFKMNKYTTKQQKIVILLSLVVILFGNIFAVLESVSVRVESLFNSLLNALDTLFNGSVYYADAAALGRVFQRNDAIDLFLDNFFFGVGFKHYWVDFPLLQSFSDSGVIFGFLYFSIYFLYPFYHSTKGYLNGIEQNSFFSLLFICNCPRLFLHGQPLDWQHMVYVVPVVCYFAFKDK